MIPQHLESTWQLLQRAFPKGITETEYYALLELLYPHMADENLAIVMVSLSGRELGMVMNDIYVAGSGKRTSAETGRLVYDRLCKAGFVGWAEDDS